VLLGDGHPGPNAGADMLKEAAVTGLTAIGGATVGKTFGAGASSGGASSGAATAVETIAGEAAGVAATSLVEGSSPQSRQPAPPRCTDVDRCK
jgi:hypothetical protein